MGVYGKDGYFVANGPEFPANGALSYGTFAVQGQSLWTYAQSTTDKRALETDGQGDRIAATWYSGTSFSFDVNLTDGQQHEVSLYLLDWDTGGRGETSPSRTQITQAIRRWTRELFPIPRAMPPSPTPQARISPAART